MKTCLAVDLGAGSGRVIAARHDGSKISLEVVCRFDNTPVEFAGHIFWNFTQLLSDIRAGLAAGAAKYGQIASVGVDTWGVDYGLIDKSGRLLGMPYAYRDSRNCPARTQEVFDLFGKRALYDATGIQFMDFNTVFQLHSEASERSSLFALADKLLFTPDLVNYALCGTVANEATIASTSGLVDLSTRKFSKAVLSSIGVPESLFSDPVAPGTVLGKVRGIPGLEGVPVVAVGSHDTASAVASVPADPSTRWGYLATGTWALLGLEIEKPVLGDMAYELNYTHEGAVNGKFRFLKNCTGMWLVQQLRRAWTRGGEAPSWDELVDEAERSEPFRSLVDPDWAPLAAPGRMQEKIAEYCRATSQPVPETRGQFYRAALEGIVMRYREVWRELEELTGEKRDVLHMIGGAIRDRMHCRMAADAMKARIECGPIEGAATGNAVAQLVGLGDAADFDEGRRIVRASTKIDLVEPTSDGAAAWDENYARWLETKRNAPRA